MKLVVLVLREGIGEPCTCAVWLVRVSARQAHSKANCFLSGIVLRDAYKLKTGRLNTSVVFMCGSKAIV